VALQGLRRPAQASELESPLPHAVHAPAEVDLMPQPTVHSSDEMAILMNRVNQLIEGRVIAMVVQGADGSLHMTLPHRTSEEIAGLLRQLPSWDETLKAADL
jgi:hypothetical protein